MGPNWKTSLSAIVSAAASFVLFSSMSHMIDWPQSVLAIAAFAGAGGLVAFGVSAKDYNVTG